MRENKFISLSEFKARNDGSGGFHAYATVFRELDDVGDIIMPGAYQKTIPQFLDRGFIAKGHDWNTRIGMPTNAGEDETGFWIDAAYHSTSVAQDERAITNERKAAGKGVFVSIGYEPSTQPIIVNAADYPSELPKYVRPDLLDTTLVKANRFPSVRVLPEVHLYEVSLVSVPALQSATVTAAKSVIDELDTDTDYMTNLERLGTAIKALGDRTEARIAMRTKEGRVLSSANLTELSSAADELEALMKRIRTLLDSATPKPKEDTTDEAKQLMAEIAISMALRNIARIGASIR